MSASTNDLEHEIFVYKRVAELMDLEYVENDTRNMKMVKNTPLTKALDDMSCIPFIHVPNVYISEGKPQLTIADVDAGTLREPKVDVILQKSTPSSFGRGSETVLDPSYRNGREISAAKILLSDSNWQSQLLSDVEKFMFPGRQVSLKLYKLAVYETGGHFGWHMDTTHSDKHHGTLLLALNTSWEGGKLMLRRSGVENSVDLRPPNLCYLQAVAFFTDTEHRVEPVKSGVRFVLQYDIEIEKKDENENAEEDKDNEEKGEDTEEKDEDNEEEGEEDEYNPWMQTVQKNYSERLGVGFSGIAHATANKAAIKKVIAIIKKMHAEDIEQVAFALQHLYRKACILPQYLKGSDATLYSALQGSGDFEISLHPVLLAEESGYDGKMNARYVYVYEPSSDYDSELPSQSDHGSEHEPSPSPPRKKQKKQKPIFHIPERSGIMEISSREYIEHTGNEAMPAKYRYFGGGMFVLPKSN